MLYSNPILNKFFQLRKNNPNKKLVIEAFGKEVTISEIYEKSLKVAFGLKKLGFKKGDRVLILVRPRSELVIFILAIMRLGGVIVIADSGMGKDVFESRVKAAKVKWVFGESIIFDIQYHPILKFILRKKGYDIPEISNISKAKIIRFGYHLPWNYNYKTLTKSKINSNEKISNSNINDEAMIIFTSGTTSSPKGVIHTYKSLKNTLEEVADICKPEKDDIFCTSLGHFLLLSVSIGVRVVLFKDKFSPELYYKILNKYKPTILFGPPAEFIELLKFKSKNKIKFPFSIKKIFIGSAPVLVGFLEKLISDIPKSVEVKCVYGMTEILPVAIVDGREKVEWKGEGDLLGNFIKNIKFRILKDGELILKGPHMFISYLNGERESYVPSGDLVKVRKNKLILIGRKKDMIIKGNYNIYPELFENTIQNISGVSACAMIGVRDKRKEDERIILIIEPYDLTDKSIKEKVYKNIRSGAFSIDTHAVPDEIHIMKLPRFGRQLKIDKMFLRRKFSNQQ